MRMKKENMEHIREMVEKETGTVLPEKGFSAAPAVTGRILMAAAGLFCLVALGLIWNGISAKKQSEAGNAPAASEDAAVLTEDTEEATPTAAEEPEAEKAPVSDDSGDVRAEEDGTDPDGKGQDAGIEQELEELGVEGNFDDGKIYYVSLFNYHDSAIVIYNASEAGYIYDEDLFGENSKWAWPVDEAGTDAPEGAEGAEEVPPGECNVIAIATEDGYLSIPGETGKSVLAMHDAVVTDCGFDTERGNYITTECNGNTIEYRHLDEILVSTGDRVEAAQKIGTLGNTGMSTGPHLGIVVRDAEDNSLTFEIITNVFPEEEP